MSIIEIAKQLVWNLIGLELHNSALLPKIFKLFIEVLQLLVILYSSQDFMQNNICYLILFEQNGEKSPVPSSIYIAKWRQDALLLGCMIRFSWR